MSVAAPATVARHEPRGRLVFANQLRGLAAISVAVSHLVGVFWLMRDFVGLATFSPVQPGPAPGLVGMITLAWFQPGPFGVAVFFLISGLVVPISLDQHTRWSFLGARALRIYPTYVAALIIEMGALYAASLYWHRPFGYGASTILANALLVFNLADLPSVDLVNWTLGVELKFYLVLALIAPQVRRGNPASLFAVAVALLAANLALQGTALGDVPAVQSLRTDSVYVVFMFAGVLFNFRLRRTLGPVAFPSLLVAMLTIALICWRAGPLAVQYPVVTINYGYGVAVFAALFAVRQWVPPSRILGAAASISYPFYLVHSMIGYSVMKLALLSWALPYDAALPLGVLAAIAVAVVLHVTVERPTIRLGRRLARKAIYSPRDDAAGPRPEMLPTTS